MKLVFNRGTLLLRDAPPKFDADGLPGLLWDPRVEALRAPAYAYPKLVAGLRQRRIPFEEEVLDPQSTEGAWSHETLRPYQEAALTSWELANRRGTLVLPTGSGKTHVALAAMARSGLSTLCLVPTRVLLAQWCRRLEAAYTGKLGCFGDGSHDVAPITVSTFESAYRNVEHMGNHVPQTWQAKQRSPTARSAALAARPRIDTAVLRLGRCTRSGIPIFGTQFAQHAHHAGSASNDF